MGRGHVTRDHESLQSWYRDAIRRRIDELTALRRRLDEGDPDACDGVRGVAQALRGSGGTFGFPEISAVARLVEVTTDAEAMRRTEGIIDFLTEFTRPAGHDRSFPLWLARAAGLADGDELDPPAPVADGEDRIVEDRIVEAWRWVTERTGLAEAELAGRIAAHLGLEVADFSGRSQAAASLVPPALVLRERIVPLREDSTTITVATSNPMSLAAEVEIERLTGRRAVFAVAGPSSIAAELSASTSVERAPLTSVEHDPSTPAGPSPSPTAPGGTIEGGRPPITSPAEEWRILLVDDDASTRLLLRTLLAKRGFSTLEAGDGIEALAMMRDDESIAMAIVDLNMPRMDGLELLWAIRDSSRWSDLPVLVVTGEWDEALETQVIEEGADDYIRKPVHPRLFLARVEATLRRAGRIPE